jgi:hypothetical protein|tara:strand:- start:591 stop:914 length:324 start_codon:yes stop_codon:yes gene_type:complete
MKALLTIIIIFYSTLCIAQVKAVHFNATWNEQNNVEWFDKLGDCDKESYMIDGNDLQKKHNIAVVPTIIIFDDGEEVKRFQADLSFTIQATRKEIQNYIDELIISKF